ncbi:MAG: TIGR02391 family protein [Promicromonosporaceae bacterium]|nr:TIGR02391 family protein [Promicromonosporaceae bacterium]
MTGIDIGWATQALQAFIHATDRVHPGNSSGVVFVGTVQRKPDSEAATLAYVAEQVLDRVLPEWRTANDRPNEVRHNARWNHLRNWSARGIAALGRQAEIQEKLGDGAPQISAGQLHPWVWDGARSLWASRHFRSAVEDALKKVNADTQNKIDRRDVSESALFQEAFSAKLPEPSKPRLRRRKDDGSDTFRSMQEGAIALAQGIYKGIRNPLGHADPTDLDEQVALECLAALSVLARWVDESTLEEAP